MQMFEVLAFRSFLMFVLEQWMTCLKSPGLCRSLAEGGLGSSEALLTYFRHNDAE